MHATSGVALLYLNPATDTHADTACDDTAVHLQIQTSMSLCDVIADRDTPGVPPGVLVLEISKARDQDVFSRCSMLRTFSNQSFHMITLPVDLHGSYTIVEFDTR